MSLAVRLKSTRDLAFLGGALLALGFGAEQATATGGCDEGCQNIYNYDYDHCGTFGFYCKWQACVTYMGCLCDCGDDMAACTDPFCTGT
jgi:hypothetical protein